MYNIEIKDIVWCANNLFVLKRPAIEYYLSNKENFMIWPEVGIINCIRTKFLVTPSKYIIPNLFGQGVAHLTNYRENIANGLQVYAIHAVKDYTILDRGEIFGPKNCGIKE
jgi:hypothetical protein